jgi:hypothetical protein
VEALDRLVDALTGRPAANGHGQPFQVLPGAAGLPAHRVERRRPGRAEPDRPQHAVVDGRRAGEEEALLDPEVVEHRLGRDAGLSADLRDGHRGEAPLGEEAMSGCGDARTRIALLPVTQARWRGSGHDLDITVTAHLPPP